MFHHYSLTVSESDDEQTEVSANVTANKPLEPVKNVGVAPVVDMETEAAQEVETVGPKEERTVFISNLPADVTKEQLKERFSEVLTYGGLPSINFLKLCLKVIITCGK